MKSVNRKKYMEHKNFVRKNFGFPPWKTLAKSHVVKIALQKLCCAAWQHGSSGE